MQWVLSQTNSGKLIALLFIWCFVRFAALAQAPSITYNTPNTYTIGAPAATLSPTNTGGTIPPTDYGTTSTFAGSTSGLVNANSSLAKFFNPGELAIDANGNIYVAERRNNVIRKITPAGDVTTFAGTGAYGALDGPPATATFDNLSGITYADGDLFLAESQNGKIRRIDMAGNVTTYIGIPNAASAFGANDGAPTVATFRYPWGLAVSASGKLFISDYNNGLIRQYVPGGSVSTLAGNTATGFADGNGSIAKFRLPIGMAVDAFENAYVTDFFNHRIRKIDPSGNVSTFVGNGSNLNTDGVGAAASISYPHGLTVDPTGNLYVTTGNVIRWISPVGRITTIAGNGTTGSVDGPPNISSFNTPQGLALDKQGNLFVADAANHLIRKICVTGYVIDKTLPAGLTFNGRTGQISGTPTVTSPPTVYTITAFNKDGSSSAAVSISVMAPTLNFNLTDKTVCDPDFDPGATSVAGPVTYSSSNLSVATIVNGKIHLTGAGQSDITANDGVSQITKTLKVSAATVPVITISGPVGEVCAGDAVTFSAAVQNVGTNPSYQWQINQVDVLNGSAESFTVSTLTSTDKVRCIVTNIEGCTTASSVTSAEVSVVVNMILLPQVTISSPDNEGYIGATVSFTAVVIDGGSAPVFTWLVNNTPVSGAGDHFSSNTLGKGDVVTCTVTPAEPCNTPATSNALTVALSYLPDIHPVSAFTPNNDGVNDTWKIPELTDFPTCRVSIYNRLGTLIYFNRGYSSPWDGTFNGRLLDVGTYYYLIELGTDKKSLKGTVTLIR